MDNLPMYPTFENDSCKCQNCKETVLSKYISYAFQKTHSLFSKLTKYKNLFENKTNRYRLGIVLDVFCILILVLYGLKINPKLISPLSPQSLSFFTNQKEKIVFPSGEKAPIADLSALSTKNMQYKHVIQDAAATIMSEDSGSLVRLKEEVKLFNFLKKHDASAADMLLALESFATRPGRALAMEYLWQLRQNGKLVEFNVFPLSQQKIQWAVSRNIDPRMLAIATDVYGITAQMVSSEPSLFFEASPKKAQDKNVAKYIPSPAVLAKLQMSETGWVFDGIVNELNEVGVTWNLPVDSREDRGFVNIGGVSAWDGLNLSPEWFPSGHTDLLWIAKELESSTGLPYEKNVKQLPGSARGWGDGSGGAIGPQFMPLNARLFMTWYQTANKKQFGSQLPTPNLFNPWTGTMLSYLYLSSEFYHRQAGVDDVITDVVRPGYSVLAKEDSELAYNSSQDPRIKALLKWNPLYWEAKTAVVAGEEYSEIWNSSDMVTYSGSDSFNSDSIGVK